jgi:4-hydroxybenzoate polyprenyltransferase
MVHAPLYTHTRNTMSNIKTEGTLSTYKPKNNIVNWIKTMRLQTGLVTALALWVGYTSVSALTVESTLILAAIGLSFHVFGFTLNEVKDADYDSSIGNGSVHPIARGEVSREIARRIAWGAYFTSVLISIVSPYSLKGTAVLILSVIPAYLYDEFSKTHWWSNVYLSTWAGMMVLSGALHAGDPNIITAALVAVIAIQIFVQVMQGDLKDLTGDEESVCRTLGVDLKSSNSYINDKVDIGLDHDQFNIDQGGVITYTKKFVGLVYSLKAVEISLMLFIVYTFVEDIAGYIGVYSVLYFVAFISFVTSLSMFMVWVYDRDYIKKYSSLHELSAIVLVGLTVSTIDPRSGVVIATTPVIWYVIVNQLLHSGALNPDV